MTENLVVERLPDDHSWWGIADPSWADPLDPSYAQRRGGRWNQPESFPTLYLNDDKATARSNLRRFIDGWPYEPEELREDNGPILVECVLPRRQAVFGMEGVGAAGMPYTCSFLEDDAVDGHDRCQPIARRPRHPGPRGVRARWARSGAGAGWEIACGPGSVRSVLRRKATSPFRLWFWG